MLTFLPTLGYTEIGVLVVLSATLYLPEAVRTVDDGARQIASWFRGQ